MGAGVNYILVDDGTGHGIAEVPLLGLVYTADFRMV
jgi:hypothetical protein